MLSVEVTDIVTTLLMTTAMVVKTSLTTMNNNLILRTTLTWMIRLLDKMLLLDSNC